MTSCCLGSMYNFKRNVDMINVSIGNSKVIVVCASKYVEASDIEKLYSLGVTHFGENRVDALLTKQNELSHLNMTWHFIGALQTNKVKKVINEVEYFHALDSIKLAAEINKHRKMPLNCFIEVNVLKEPMKHGIFCEDLEDFLKELKKYDKIKVVGLMTMGKNGNLAETEYAFRTLNELKIKYHLSYTSMGMTDDYEIALKYHANFVRIGRKFII